MTNPNAAANLTKKGADANPNGRPKKGYSITETVQAMLNEKPEIKQALVTKVMEMALKGDIAAQKMIWQYMDGMPKQSMDVTSGGEKLPTPIYGGQSVK